MTNTQSVFGHVLIQGENGDFNIGNIMHWNVEGKEAKIEIPPSEDIFIYKVRAVEADDLKKLVNIASSKCLVGWVATMCLQRS